MTIIGKINDKVSLDDCVLRREPKVLTRWIDPTTQEKDKEIERLNNIIDELEKSILQKLESYKNDKEYFIDEKTMEDLYKELKELKEGKENKC